jgi:hypothetical protein
MFTETELNVLKHIVGKELNEFEKDESTIRDQSLAFLAAEEKYDELLKGILDKL